MERVESRWERHDVWWEIAVPGAVERVDRKGVLLAQDFDWCENESYGGGFERNKPLCSSLGFLCLCGGRDKREWGVSSDLSRGKSSSDEVVQENEGGAFLGVGENLT
jgi:hypothetical protein